MNVSCLSTQRINNVGNLCQDPETKGFDLQSGQSWIYPTNYPVRDYQYNIVQEALFKNTLVSLPTGLGKTFIAAVVMYNFYRWYPHDKIIFMAPSRPLVRQQMDACYNIMAIPQEATAELTGTKVQQSRKEIWHSKRVFFITPQVLQNDLEIIVELGPKIKCLVFDEAHRAKGNHAFCEVIRKILPTNKLFRVLALSATPGNSSRDVIEVMQNLLIARVEFRSEESPDVKPFVFERALETVVVPLGDKLQQIKDQYLQILEKYTRTLIQYKVIYGNCANLTKGKIFMVMKEFQARNSGSRTPNYGEIMKSLNICVTLYHAYETLIRCGLRAFLNFYEEHINNPLLSGNIALRQILDDLRNYLGPAVEVQPLPDGTFGKIPSSTKFGHPKFYKLRDILWTHFKNSDNSTRVIVFFEYRESVSEAYTLLSQNHPMIRARVFVGQGSGVRQKDQINTVKAFREGTCNTLLSTSIGEEGLDVGEVDLIVCFDIANKSPIRMIQRMGRTGRKKEGRVVVLVTEGREQQTLKDCLIYKNNLGNFVTNSDQLEDGIYRDNPKMVPSYIQPKCQKMFITVKKPVLAKDANLKDMLKRIASDGPKFDEDMEIVEIEERILTKVQNFWNKKSPLEFNLEPPKIDFSKHLEKQRSFQEVGSIKRSKQTEIFVSLLQFADSKRFNLPVTQEIGKFGGFTQNKFLKQGDIRTMFAKPPTTSLSQETYLPNSQNFNFDKEKDITRSFPQELFDEISTFLSINDSMKDKCKTCDFLFECPKTVNNTEKIDSSGWVQPDLSILGSITLQDLQVFSDSLTPKSKEIHRDLLELDDGIFDNVTFDEFPDANSSIVECKNKSLRYETPRNFDKILESFRICDDKDQSFDEVHEEKSFKYETPKTFTKVLKLMGSSGTQEVEADISSKKEKTQRIRPRASGQLETVVEDLESVYLNKVSDQKQSSVNELLSFFKLSSFEDFFANSCPKVVDLDKTVIYTQKSSKDEGVKFCDESPDLFPSSEEKQNTPVKEPHSPILCSYERTQQLKAKKRLFDESRADNVKKPKLSNLKLQRKSFYESPKKRTKAFNKSPEKRPVLDIGDVCDLSSFLGPDLNIDDQKKEDEATLFSQRKFADKNESQNNTNGKTPSKNYKILEESRKEKNDLTQGKFNDKDESRNKSNRETHSKNYKVADKNRKEESDLDISDVCDLSIFGLSGSSTQTKEDTTTKDTVNEKIVNKPKENGVKEFNIDDLCDLSEFFGEEFVEARAKQNEEKPKHNKEKPKQNEEKPKQNEEKPIEEKLGDISDLDDFCDFSYFMGTPKQNKTNRENDLKQTPKKNTQNTQVATKKVDKVQETVARDIIVLTDSDPEPSPVKFKPTQAPKTPTQLSITQMLSLIRKTDTNSSQKENNSTPKRMNKTQKLSLSTKKSILQPKQKTESPKITQRKVNKEVTPKSQKKKINISISVDSEDEFEEAFRSPIFTKPKPVKKNEESLAKKSKIEAQPSSKQPKKRKKLSDFIEVEAVVSDDETTVISEDEDEDDDDCFEASFVADETQDLNNTSMHAKYLQSVKSPRRGGFKIPEKFKHNISNVFSQAVDNEDNSYMNDSFCVNSQDVDNCDQHDLSELEILEKRLKEMKRDKKRKKSQDNVKTKRRRIITVLSQSDDSD